MMAVDWFDERVIGPLAGLVAAVILGWRVAKRTRINISTNNNNSNNANEDGNGKQEVKTRTDLLCSIDNSLKVLVDGQKEAIIKLDQMAEDVGSTRRELAQLWGSVFGRGNKG